MLTSRGWWFLVVAATLLGLGLFSPPSPSRDTLTIVAATLALWFGWEWLVFQVRSKILLRRLQIEREVCDERGPVESLWAGRSFRVRVRLHLPPAALGFPFISLRDFLPFGADMTEGENIHAGPLAAGKTVEIAYRLHCPATGRIRFEGIHCQLADFQGFFYQTSFLAAVKVYQVLPSLAAVDGPGAAVKRHNILPPPGVHRHRRPGSGSELLDLRDYLPGDPPKTIAWKVSARRDRLITKEFESEVPVRCTLFVDRSNSVRLGPPGQNALARLVDLAAAVAQSNAGTRDLTGLCLFDEEGSTFIRPARGARHLVHLVNVLADAAGLAPSTGKVRPDTLLPLALAFAQEVYPHLLRPELNRMPFWLPWLWPQPGYTIRRPTFGQRLQRFLPLLSPAFGILGLWVLFFAVVFSGRVLARAEAAGLLCLALLVILTGALVIAYLRAHPSFFFAKQRRHYRWRKLLSAILSVRHGLAPGGLAMLLEDDEQFSLHVQRFLAEHQVPYALPLYDGANYLFAAPEKVKVLATALLRAVGRGHDNELFVLFADFLELSEQLDPVVKAIKVALARHHQVMLICPWPPGMPTPGERKKESGIRNQESGKKRETVQEVLRQATVDRLQRAYFRVRRQLARLGVPVVCAAEGEPARLILDRLERLRGLGKRR